MVVADTKKSVWKDGLGPDCGKPLISDWGIYNCSAAKWAAWLFHALFCLFVFFFYPGCKYPYLLLIIETVFTVDFFFFLNLDFMWKNLKMKTWKKEGNFKFLEGLKNLELSRLKFNHSREAINQLSVFLSLVKRQVNHCDCALNLCERKKARHSSSDWSSDSSPSNWTPCIFFSKGRFQPSCVQENIRAPYAEHILRELDGFCHLLSLT